MQTCKFRFAVVLALFGGLTLLGGPISSDSIQDVAGRYCYEYTKYTPGEPLTYGGASTAKVENNSSLTFALNVTGNERYIVVGVSSRDQAVTGITYSGDAMSLLGSKTNGSARVYMYGLVAPQTGNNNVIVTMAANDDIVAGAIFYTGVDQSVPTCSFTSATGNGTPATADISCHIGDIVVDTVAADDAALTVGVDQTERWNDSILNSTYGGGSTEPGAGTNTMSWALGAENDWCICGIGVRD